MSCSRIYGVARDAALKNLTQIVLAFPCASGVSGRRDLEKELVRALRMSEFPVLIDLSECRTLDHRDISALLDCVALGAGRDTQLALIAGSPAVRILLEVTRIASLVTVFDSRAEALAYTLRATVETIPEYAPQLRQSA